MNRRKTTSSLGFPSLVLLGIAVVIVSSSLIGFVVMKNKQVTARTRIAEVRKEMEKHEVTITLHKSDIEEQLGYYRLRQQLQDRKSKLKEIKYVEVYQEPDSDQSNGGSVARR